MNLDCKYQRFCHTYDFWGAIRKLTVDHQKAFALFHDHLKTRVFLAVGHSAEYPESVEKLNRHPEILRISSLSYDLKNAFEELRSEQKDVLQWPDIMSFDAHTLVVLKNEGIGITGDIDWYKKNLSEFENKERTHLKVTRNIQLNSDTDFDTYQQQFGKIRTALQRGDIYELNYCINSTFEDEINPIAVAQKLIDTTKAPFSAIARFDGRWILSGSPERFIKKTKKRLTSQPIKGTAKRGNSTEEDTLISQQLINDIKERSENIMIVDLVRNDLSRIAKMNSVQVEALCELHTFETVHQLISTISCETEDEVKFDQILSALFPMGSMTGAPKVSAMQLIESFEDFRRGHYSGSLGYQTPNGDFDFNVLIRSIFYDETSKTGMVPAGGAITIESDCQKEYEEVLLKLNAMQKALQC